MAQRYDQPYDSNKRWYDEYHATFRLLCQADAENSKPIQRIHVLERDAQSQALTERAIYGLGTADLLCFAQECMTLARALVAELRKRHVELTDELRGLWPQSCMRGLGSILRGIMRPGATQQRRRDEQC